VSAFWALHPLMLYLLSMVRSHLLYNQQKSRMGTRWWFKGGVPWDVPSALGECTPSQLSLWSIETQREDIEQFPLCFCNSCKSWCNYIWYIIKHFFFDNFHFCRYMCCVDILGTHIVSAWSSLENQVLQRQRPGSGEVESFLCLRPCIEASGETENWSVEGSQPSRSRARRWLMMLGSGEAVMFRDPWHEASDEVGEWAGTLTWPAGGPARGELARGSSWLILLLDGVD
jgi:hypothetical protein